MDFNSALDVDVEYRYLYEFRVKSGGRPPTVRFSISLEQRLEQGLIILWSDPELQKRVREWKLAALAEGEAAPEASYVVANNNFLHFIFVCAVIIFMDLAELNKFILFDFLFARWGEKDADRWVRKRCAPADQATVKRRRESNFPFRRLSVSLSGWLTRNAGTVEWVARSMIFAKMHTFKNFSFSTKKYSTPCVSPGLLFLVVKLMLSSKIPGNSLYSFLISVPCFQRRERKLKLETFYLKTRCASLLCVCVGGSPLIY